VIIDGEWCAHCWRPATVADLATLRDDAAEMGVALVLEDGVLKKGRPS
jgi:hypothetical protein